MILLKTILSRLGKNPVKSLLTILSITLGVLIVSLVLNINKKILGIKNSTADKTIFHVLNGEMNGEYDVNYSDEFLLTDDVADNLKRELPGVEDVVIMIPWINSPIAYGSDKFQPNIGYAVESSYLKINNIEITNGDAFNSESSNREMLISEEIKDFIFSDKNPIGETISVQWWGDEYVEGEINYRDFTIIGVYKTPLKVEKDKRGIPDILYSYEDFKQGYYNNLSIKVKKDEVDNFEVKLEQYLKSILGEDKKFIIWTGSPSKVNSYDYTDGLEMFVIFFSILAMVCLIISSFGVFSMTMVAVLERNKDVGLKRALGGTRSIIIKEFLIESIIIIIIGSVFGVIFAALLNSQFIKYIIPGLGYGQIDYLTGMSLSLDPLSVLISVGVTVLFGAIFGLFPSLTAAKSTPIEAIKEN